MSKGKGFEYYLRLIEDEKERDELRKKIERLERKIDFQESFLLMERKANNSLVKNILEVVER
jgi:hypothetical protein